MQKQGYQQFCPVAMACEILEPRWTMLILCEMWSGSTRFSDIQRGVPGMSPSLLSKRLKDMEAEGLLTRTIGLDGHIDYRTTPMADELEPLVHGLGAWIVMIGDQALSRSLPQWLGLSSFAADATVAQKSLGASRA